MNTSKVQRMMFMWNVSTLQSTPSQHMFSAVYTVWPHIPYHTFEYDGLHYPSLWVWPCSDRRYKHFISNDNNIDCYETCSFLDHFIWPFNILLKRSWWCGEHGIWNRTCVNPLTHVQSTSILKSENFAPQMP